MKRFGVNLEAVDQWQKSDPLPQASRMDLGVSFGLPMVANVAAKLKLLNPNLKAVDLARIIKTTAVVTQQTTDSKDPVIVRMMNPSKAYQNHKQSAQGAILQTTGQLKELVESSTSTTSSPRSTNERFWQAGWRSLRKNSAMAWIGVRRRMPIEQRLAGSRPGQVASVIQRQRWRGSFSRS